MLDEYGEIVNKYFYCRILPVITRRPEEEIAFLRALTDSFILQEYPSFFFIDKNSSKKEAIEFYDNFEGESKEDEIGSSAGILMGIKASDFIELLGEIKK